MVWAAVCGLAWQQWPYKCCLEFELLPAPGTLQPCELTGRLADLVSKGYAVVPNFISAEDAGELLQLNSRLPPDPVANNGHNSGFKTPRLHGVDPWEVAPATYKQILQLVRKVGGRTDIHLAEAATDLKMTELFIHTNASLERTIMFHWHQDHESFFVEQEHDQYLNFYIILSKPHAKQAGLQVVPFDTLKARSPELHDFAKGYGATRFDVVAGGNRTIVYADSDDRKFGLGFDINEVACTPELHARDLLILRGDIIHRTQPHKSARTSLTVRVATRRTIDVHRLFQGGIVKYQYMLTAPHHYIRAALESGAAHQGGVQATIPYWLWRIRLGMAYRVALLPFRILIGALTGEPSEPFGGAAA